MLLTVEQITQIHSLLQEYPTTTLVALRSESNGSAIGPSMFADYYKHYGFSTELLGTLEITDYRLW